jgi:uncharacterized protein with PIN domain
MQQLGIEEQRVVLTGDTSVVSMRDCLHVYVVAADKKAAQLREVIQAFRILLDPKNIMSRCTFCGGHFMAHTLRLDELPTVCSVPVGMKDLHDEFWVCAMCAKVFWRGQQYQSAVQNLTARCQDLCMLTIVPSDRNGDESGGGGGQHEIGMTCQD